MKQTNYKSQLAKGIKNKLTLIYKHDQGLKMTSRLQNQTQLEMEP